MPFTWGGPDSRARSLTSSLLWSWWCIIYFTECSSLSVLLCYSLLFSWLSLRLTIVVQAWYSSWLFSQNMGGGGGVVHLECVTNWFVVSCASYAFKVVPPIASSKSLESAKRNPERVFESRHLFSFFSRTHFVIWIFFFLPLSFPDKLCLLKKYINKKKWRKKNESQLIRLLWLTREIDLV